MKILSINSNFVKKPVIACALFSALIIPNMAKAGETVHLLVVNEGGVGGTEQAQTHVDTLVKRAGDLNKWTEAKGTYTTSRTAAEDIVKKETPQFGILSLSTFLNFREPYKLEVIGQAEVNQGGGRQYYIVSASANELAGCKGKTLVSNHLNDEKFIEKVVAGSDFKLSEFTVSKVKRPLQAIRGVIKKEAECALIDDAQFKDLSNIEGGTTVHSVWQSKSLPPMVVVAFPAANKAQNHTFKQNLTKVCQDAGQEACKNAGITSLKPASKSEYSTVISAYGTR